MVPSWYPGIIHGETTRPWLGIRTAMGPIRVQPDCQSLTVVISCAYDSHLRLHRVQAPVVCPARAWAGRHQGLCISHLPLSKADTAPPRSLAPCACSPRPFPSPSIKFRCWVASNTWSGECLHPGAISAFILLHLNPPAELEATAPPWYLQRSAHSDDTTTFYLPAHCVTWCCCGPGCGCEPAATLY